MEFIFGLQRDDNDSPETAAGFFSRLPIFPRLVDQLDYVLMD
jgi:hypothetical protein